jgi:hypothetical protein
MAYRLEPDKGGHATALPQDRLLELPAGSSGKWFGCKRRQGKIRLPGSTIRSGVSAMVKIMKSTMVLGAAVLALLSSGVSFAQNNYGSQLMTPEEWAEHWSTMRSLPPGEREAYRARHHEAMKERAESMGLSLPDQPPAYGRFGRRGPGYGYGRGRGYWGPGYRRAAPWYGGPGYGPWREREEFGPGRGDWGDPAR